MSNDKSGTTEEKSEVRFNVRLPAILHERLIVRAKAAGRSMNSEIIEILTSAIFPRVGAARELTHKRNQLAHRAALLEQELQQALNQLSNIRHEMTELDRRLAAADTPSPD